MDSSLNAQRFTGNEYVKVYDAFRPSPPLEIIHQTLNYLNTVKAKTIVDLGCGTGISTTIWSPYAEKVIGIEPSSEMISIAKGKMIKNNISYQIGFSDHIPLPSKSVDIITCSQSFHWMEPKNTLAEINRVLKKNSVLVIYDVIWPPTVGLEFENAYRKLFTKVDQLTHDLKEVIAHRWQKKEHFKNIINSDYFNFFKETYFHKTEKIDKGRFIGIALSQGGLEALLKRGYTEKQIGIIEFKNEIAKSKDLPYQNLTYNYRVIFATKH